MFKNLMDFSYKRTTLEAIGFYFAFLFLSILIAGVVGGILGMMVGVQKAGAIGRMGGYIVAIIFCTYLSFQIIREKNLFKNFGAIVLFLLTILLSLFGGGLLGLIPTTMLSSKNTTMEQGE